MGELHWTTLGLGITCGGGCGNNTRCCCCRLPPARSLARSLAACSLHRLATTKSRETSARARAAAAAPALRLQQRRSPRPPPPRSPIDPASAAAAERARINTEYLSFRSGLPPRWVWRRTLFNFFGHTELSVRRGCLAVHRYSEPVVNVRRMFCFEICISEGEGREGMRISKQITPKYR